MCGRFTSSLPHDHYHTCDKLCKRGPGHRHDSIVRTLARLAREVSGNVTVEPSSAAGAPDRRRPDIRVELTRQTLLIDVSVSTLSAASVCVRAARIALSCAAARETDKTTRYTRLAESEESVFLPFVVESSARNAATSSTHSPANPNSSASCRSPNSRRRRSVKSRSSCSAATRGCRSKASVAPKPVRSPPARLVTNQWASPYRRGRYDPRRSRVEPRAVCRRLFSPSP
jgi:hypothetical protein